MKQSEVSRSEHRSMLFIQIALLLVVGVGAAFFVFHRQTEAEPAQGRKNSASNPSTAFAYSDGTSPLEAESFPFDPNTADSTTLLRLGLTRVQVQNIYRYRAKGGVFHRPEQFKRLYYLTVEQWEHLKPLIRIGQKYQYLADTPDAYNPAKDGYPRHQGDGNYRGNGYYSGDKDYYGSGNSREDGGHPAHGDWHENSLENTDGQEGSSAAYGRRSALYGKDGKRDTTLYPIKLHPGQTIELNRADTTALKRIPGIGSYYARKIVQHRDKLGGFVSIAQLEELENLPMGIESYMTLDKSAIQKIKINRATLRQLNAHPYISYYQARAITSYIHLDGPIHSFADISLLPEFTQEDFQRLTPYIDFSE